jgi:hypothetical protein
MAVRRVLGILMMLAVPLCLGAAWLGARNQAVSEMAGLAEEIDALDRGGEPLSPAERIHRNREQRQAAADRAWMAANMQFFGGIALAGVFLFGGAWLLFGQAVTPKET